MIKHKLPASEYHAYPSLNNSGIKQLLKSPAHYQAYLAEPHEQTKAMLIGSATHSAVLEPHLFEAEYIAMPDGIDRRTKEGKAAYAELEASGKTILYADDYENVLQISKAVRTHDTAGRLLGMGEAEVSIFTEIDGVPAKCRADWLRQRCIVDVKTTDDASPEGFARSIAKYGYDIQAAWYLDCCAAAGIEAYTFVFVAVEKSAPYAVGIYELDYASLEVGRSKYQRALSLWKHCTATDEWPGYSPEIITLSLPAWAMKEAA